MILVGFLLSLPKFLTTIMKYLFTIAIAVLLLTSCHHHHDEEEQQQPARQTVLVYMAGDNNLSSFVEDDMVQMIRSTRTLSDEDNLLMFVDTAEDSPYMLKASKGDTVRVAEFSESQFTSSAETLRDAMLWAMTHYEARQYGLVLWGHADGWIIKNHTDVAGSRTTPNRSYGQDRNGNGTGSGTWMDIPEMARALESLPRPEGSGKVLRFLFADCCCFQCIESDYELRNVTDYIIASAAEIPGEGAPYHAVLPALMSMEADFYKQAVDAYYSQVIYGYYEPLSVVKTSELDNLAQATRTVLKQSIGPLSEGYPSVDSLIYYYDHTMFDMNDFVMSHASENDYSEWRRAFDMAVPYSTWAEVWLANFVPYLDAFFMRNFRDFVVTEQRYGGVSMFVPQNPNAVNYKYQSVVEMQNKTISRMQWYRAAGLDELGW